MKKSLEERFWSKVDIRSSKECWEWRRSRNGDGYGRFRIRTGISPSRSSRVAWILTHGDPGDLFVLHRCDNPPCCNPAHLFLGTNADNMADMVAKGRANGGGGLGPQEESTRDLLSESLRKLTDKRLVIARERKAKGESLRSIAQSMDISHSTLSRALRGKTRYSSNARQAPPGANGEIPATSFGEITPDRQP